MLKTYMRGVDRAVDATPKSRNRVVDTWRVIALLAVVFGHWLAASVWVEPDGTVTVLNTLEWIPYAGWFTWIVQVMPVFFFVGGYANARALEKSTTNRRSWITIRFRRLFTPAVPVILLWTLLAFILRNFIDADLVYAGVLNATLPLWFLAVYLTLVAIAPLTLAWWHRWGLWSVGCVRPSGHRQSTWRIAVWMCPASAGSTSYSCGEPSTNSGTGGQLVRRTMHVLQPGGAMALSVAALAGLVLVTSIGWYPVAMLTIPGGGPQNVTPPTSAMTLLALMQIGVILATVRWVAAWAKSRRSVAIRRCGVRIHDDHLCVAPDLIEPHHRRRHLLV